MALKSKKTAAAKPPAKRVIKTAAPIYAPPATPPVAVTSAQRQRMIETEAYFLAEKNGFAGNPAHYWVQAEKLVDAKLGWKK